MDQTSDGKDTGIDHRPRPESVAGVSAAIEVGIAVGLLGRSTLGADMRIIDAAGFGPTPRSKLVLVGAQVPDSAPMQAMCSAIRQAFHAHPVVT